MTISFSGLASGLDTSSWIEALTSIRQLSVTSLQTKKNSISAEQAEMNKIQSMFSNVQTALDRLTDSKFGGASDLFVQKGVDTSGAEAFTATVTSSAVNGNYDIYVQQLATATVAKSLNAVSTYIDANTTTLADLEINDGGSLTVSVGNTTKTLTIDNSLTISGFNSQLNDEGLNAALSVDEYGYIKFEGKNNESIRLNFVTDNSNFLFKLGLREYTNAQGKTYFKSDNSFYSMGLNTTLVHNSDGNVYNGSNSVSEGKIKINHLEFQIDADTTLNDLIQAINNNQDESLATASWNEKTGKLKLTSTKMGHSIMTLIDTDETGFFDTFGLSSIDAQELGQNAIININGSGSVYLSGTKTSISSTEEVSASSTLLSAGTCTTAASMDLSTLLGPEALFDLETTTLSDLGINDNGNFQINGVTVNYTSSDTIDGFIGSINSAAVSAEEGSGFSADLNENNQIVITAQNVGSNLIDFESTDINNTSLLSKFGFTSLSYGIEYSIIDDAKGYNAQGVLKTVTSTGRIDANAIIYYDKATSIYLSGVGTDALSAFEDSLGESLGLDGNYEIRVNGQSVNFNSSETMNTLCGKINQLIGVSANYSNNHLVINSDTLGVDLTIEDITGHFAYKMGYLNKNTVNTTVINPVLYDPETYSISAVVSREEELTYDTRTSQNLTSILNNVNSETTMSDLGITDSVIQINGGNNVEIDHDMTVTEVCNEIEHQNTNIRASFNGTGIVLTTTEAGGTTPITVSATSGNFGNVMGWVDSYSTITSSHTFIDPVTSYQAAGTFVDPITRIQESSLDSVIGGSTVEAAETALRAALSTNATTIGISNKYALQALANVVNGIGGDANNCAGVEFVLTDNIDLSTVNNWTAIGNNTNKFNGNFDGNGYSILNMTVTGNDYVGLFGYIEGSTISNTALINATVSGTGNYVGGLVGDIDNHSSVTNSYATGSVSGTHFVGGLVGQASNNSSVTNSYASGSVSGTGICVGGLIGAAYSNSSVTNSYATGSVSGTDDVGGLVGKGHNSSVTNSHATGSVSGTNCVGGLVGQADTSSVTNSYATGSVSGTGWYAGGLVGWAGSSSSVTNSYATGSVSGSDRVGGLVGGSGGSSVTDSTAYTSVSGMGSNIGGFLGYDDSNTTTFSNNKYVDNLSGCSVGNVNGTVAGITLNTTLTPPTVVIGGSSTVEATAALRAALAGGSVKIGISNEYALQALANVVNGIGGDANNCAGVEFVLTDNIDLSTVNNWTAIGNNTNKFNGNFDGNGHSILNMTVTGTDCVGLFGYIEGSTISNTALINATVSGTGDCVGGLVGVADHNSSVTNSYVTGTVSGTRFLGGLVGAAYHNSSVTNSYATGTVSGNSEVGGLVGRATQSSVTDSYASGSVSGEFNVGGLVGAAYSYSSITNSIAYTSVSGTGSNIGGFVGQNYNNTTTFSNNKYVDNTYDAVGSTNGIVSGIQLDTTLISLGDGNNYTLSTSLSSLHFVGSGTISINGVNTQAISSSDTIGDVISAINNLIGTTNITASLSNGEILLTSGVSNQAITVADSTGNLAATLGLLAPNAINGGNYQANNYGQSTTNVQGWKVNGDSLICNNTTDFTQIITAGNFYINDHKFTLTASTKLQDLINDINTAQIGVEASYEDGTFTISSPYNNNFTMRKGESNFTEVYNLTTPTTTTTYSQNYSAFSQASSFDIDAKLIEADDMFDSENRVTTGYFSINGTQIEINGNTTLRDLCLQINNNSDALLVIDSSEDGVKLKLVSKPLSSAELSIERGSTNFTDIVKWTEGVERVTETEQNQTLGTDAQYGGRATSSSVLYGNNQFKSITVDGIEKSIGVGGFSINGVDFEITESTTLGGIINDINGSAAGVIASWNYDNGKLTITSKTEGNEKINFVDGQSNFLTVMRVTDENAQALGSNGFYEVFEGKTITSYTNTITSDVSKIDGLTLYLHDVSKTVNNRIVADKVTISNDTSYLEASIMDFVDMYNELITELDSATSSSGIFHKDIGVKSLATQIKSSVNSTLANNDSRFKMLAQLGVKTAAPGASLNTNTNLLTVDVNKLHSVVSSDTEEVKKFMLGTNSDYSNGIMTRLNNMIFNTMKSNGFFATRSSLYGSQINRYDTLISTAKTRIANYRSSLETKFASMEKLISSLQTAYSKMYGTLGINSSSVSGFFG